MKKFLCYLFLLILFTACSERDDLKKKIVLNDSVDLYLALANSDTLTVSQKLVFNGKALTIIKGQKNDSTKIVSLFRAANRFYNLSDFKQYKDVSREIESITKKTRDTLNLAKSYVYLGDYYYRAQINDSALFHYDKAAKIYKKINDVTNLGGTYIVMARVKGFAYDYVGSELLITQALTLLRNSNEKQKMYEAYSILGYISNELQDFPKALEAHNTALQLVRENNLNNVLHQAAASLNNIGNVYQNQGKHSEAIKNFNEALQEKDLFNDRPDLYAILIDNLAYSKFKTNDDGQVPGLFFKALHIRDSLNLTSSVIFSKIRLSEYYLSKNDSTRANKFAVEALDLSKRAGISTDVVQSLRQILQVNPRKSSIYYKQYINLSDSLKQAERQLKDKFARIQFETDEISLQKDKLEEKNRNLLLFFVGTVMIGLLLFVIRTQRAKNRELMLKQAQQKANEEIYNLMIAQQNKIEEGRIREKKRIAQELHDGVLSRLFGARLNLDSLNKMDGGEATDKRNNYLTELKNIEQDIREISHDLNREKFVLINNFLAILTNLLEEQSNNFETEVETDLDDHIPWEKINNNLKINIYRIVQEALQNVNKYAKATKVKVTLREQDGNLKLEVSDNGQGFSVSKKSKGIGLSNMVSRTEECDGQLEIKSKKGKGTTICITFPTESKPNEDQIASTEPVIA